MDGTLHQQFGAILAPCHMDFLTGLAVWIDCVFPFHLTAPVSAAHAIFCRPPKLFPKLPGAAGKHAAASRIACVATAMLTLSRQSSPEAQQLLQMLGSLSRSGSLTPSPAGSKRGSLDIAAGHGPRSPGGHTPSRQSLEAAATRAFSSGGCGSLPHLTSSTHAPSPGDMHPNFGLNPALSPTLVRVPDGGWRGADGSSHAIGSRSSTGGLGAGGGLGSGDGSGCSSPKAYGVHSSLLAIASAKAARALMDGRASGSNGASGMLLQVRIGMVSWLLSMCGKP